LLGERLRSLFRPPGLPGPVNDSPLRARAAVGPAYRNGRAGDTDRPSNGLRQFFEAVRGPRLRILDLGGACQSNINFITSQGHRLYSEDVLVSVERLASEARDNAARGGLSRQFLDECLGFADQNFDGILVWDTLEFLDEDVLQATVARLLGIIKPGGTLLAFFHTQAKGQTVPVYRYQIQSPGTLRLQLRFVRPMPRAFNNRHLERLFGQFRSVKFFLAKDGLREVIVTR